MIRLNSSVGLVGLVFTIRSIQNHLSICCKSSGESLSNSISSSLLNQKSRDVSENTRPHLENRLRK